MKTREIKAVENSRAALEMRLQGLTYASIGEGVGMTAGGAHKAVARAVEAARKNLAESAETLIVVLETERLGRIDARGIGIRPWRAAFDSTEVILKCMERRAKLLGLDAATRMEISGRDGGPISFEEQERQTLGDQRKRCSPCLPNMRPPKPPKPPKPQPGPPPKPSRIALRPVGTALAGLPCFSRNWHLAGILNSYSVSRT